MTLNKPLSIPGPQFLLLQNEERVGYIAKDLEMTDIPTVKIKHTPLLYHLYLTLGESLTLFEPDFSIYIT